MEIFDAHDRILSQYESYINSFIHIDDDRIAKKVNKEIGENKLWPAPLIQFNPGYEKGLSFKELCSSGVLNKELRNIFDFTPHKHQEHAIRLGTSGKSFVVTSGTGSGKSLTYIASIFNSVFQSKKEGDTPSVKALLIYPMNALINSQFIEIEKFAEKYFKNTGKKMPITFEQYTGQEKQEKKDEIIANQPDIILTNYMMLELMLIRPKEKLLRDSILKNLQFLVFDELHTYRGRQGADVSMLIRRIRQSISNQNLICIGTSATLATDSETKTKTQQVADTASDIFGITFPSEQIVEEFLTTNFSGHEVNGSEVRDYLQKEIIADGVEVNLINSPLSNWIEQHIALVRKNDKWERRKPITFVEIEKELSSYTGVPHELCKKRLQEFFQQIRVVNLSLENSNRSERYLPFKIHQFVRQTGTVYLTLESRNEREISLDPAPVIEKNDRRLPLYPVMFSRVTGIEFYRVKMDLAGNQFKPWLDDFRVTDSDEEDATTNGYLILSPQKGEDYWRGEADYQNLPTSWFSTTVKNGIKPKKEYVSRFPQKFYVNPDGTFSDLEKDGSLAVWFMQHKLLFDITAMMIYPPRTNENTKLSRLGNEGRSTATTILSYGIVKTLSDLNEPKNTQKVLSFIDNRQDAALQSGHFNDFIRVGVLRTAINSAIQKNGILEYSNISQKVFEELKMMQSDYAEQPVSGPLSRDNENAFKKLLFYNLVYDLRRSWRVVLPNLEQCGLLKISYKALDDVINEPSEWQSVEILRDLSTELRSEIIINLLEFIRTQFAIQSSEFERNTLEQNMKVIQEKLNRNWRLGENERIDEPNWMRIENTSQRNVFTESLHAQGAWGRYFKFKTQHLNLDFRIVDYNRVTLQILDNLARLGYLRKDDKGDVPLFRLNVDVILWIKGDGKMIRDEVRMRTNLDQKKLEPNQYFKIFYSQDISGLKNRLAGEHTGQLSYELRQKNEKAFRHDKDVSDQERLCALFCSPTMELGIDISELIAVHMRNVPPNPANYTQRSGRAGRSGQGALVFTYCSLINPHDRHYFENKQDMVAGIVRPIHLDFRNQELWATHLHAIALSIAGIGELQKSLGDVIDIEHPALKLKDNVEYEIKNINENETQKNLLRQAMLAIMKEHDNDLSNSYWYYDNWLDDKIKAIYDQFNKSFDRWREMFRKATITQFEANRTIESPHISRISDEYRNARREQDRAQRKLDLLLNKGMKNSEESEFFPYRYLASEGFLPGYNFSRLPLRLFLEDSSTGGDYISRPRKLALNEFGPDNIIYYNGSKYKVNRMELEPGKNDDKQNDIALETMKVFVDSGYVLLNEEASRDTSPFSPSDSNDPTKYELMKNLLPMLTMRAYSTERIGCDEEERLRKGYEKDTFFHHENIQAIQDKKVKVINGDDQYLNLHYLPAADLVHINYHWKVSAAQRTGGGFAIDVKNGKWLTEKEIENRVEQMKSDFKRVHLYTKDTADALYIEPLPHLQLSKAGAITLMYALKRAITDYFQLEQSEIDVQLMGKPENPNLFIYESAEGSLGVISQIAEKADIFREIIALAYSICHFQDGNDIHPRGKLYYASYDDLLNYYNQFRHEEINRHEIKAALELLLSSTFDIQKKRTHEEQYKHLNGRYDESSKMEKQFLDYLRKNKLQLPDQAQKNMSELGCFVSVDFFYEPNICVFCDGSVHDSDELIREDKEKRECLERHGYKILTWHYKTKLEDFVKEYNNIFKPVVSTAS